MTPVYQEKLHNSLWLWKMVKCRAGVKLTFKINDSDKKTLKISNYCCKIVCKKMKKFHFHEMKIYLMYHFFKIEISFLNR